MSSTNSAPAPRTVAGGVHHERATVEDELVLAAHLVHVGDGAPGLGHPWRATARRSASRPIEIGRGVHVDDEAGTARRLGRDRARREPQVLAHRHPHGHAGDPIELEVGRPRREPPLLVEDAVVGQPALVVHAEHRTPDAHGHGVAQAARRPPDGGLPGHRTGPAAWATASATSSSPDDVHEPDQGDAAGRGRGHLLEGGQVVRHEGRLEQQVLGRVAR